MSGKGRRGSAGARETEGGASTKRQDRVLVLALLSVQRWHAPGVVAQRSRDGGTVGVCGVGGTIVVRCVVRRVVGGVGGGHRGTGAPRAPRRKGPTTPSKATSGRVGSHPPLLATAGLLARVPVLLIQLWSAARRSCSSATQGWQYGNGGHIADRLPSSATHRHHRALTVIWSPNLNVCLNRRVGHDIGSQTPISPRCVRTMNTGPNGFASR